MQYHNYIVKVSYYKLGRKNRCSITGSVVEKDYMCAIDEFIKRIKQDYPETVNLGMEIKEIHEKD